MMQHIVFLDRGTIAPQIKIRRPAFAHNWIEYARTSGDEIPQRAKDATVIINNKVRLSADRLSQLPKLRHIAVAATGYDCIDIEYCRRHDITVSNIRAYAVNTVPEHTFALILSLRRSLFGYRQDVVKGEWEKSGQFCFFSHPIRDLAGSNLVIIGEGSIGQSVATIGRAFGMDVFFAAHKDGGDMGSLYTPWEEALEIADVVSIHCPLTSATRNMMGIKEFRKMKRRPMIINTARGNLVVEKDLEIAMQKGMICGAGFDVTAEEPVSYDSPLMRLTRMPNFILTPHIAWASEEAQQSLADQLIDNIENFAAGRFSNRVV